MEMAHGQGKYKRWSALAVNSEEGVYLNETARGQDANLYRGEARLRELAANTVAFNAQVVLARTPALPVIASKPWLQAAGNYIVKRADNAAEELSNWLFSVHK